MAGFDQGVGATFFDLNSLQVRHTTQNVHGTGLGAQLRHTTRAHNSGTQLRHPTQAHNTSTQLRHTTQDVYGITGARCADW